MAHKCSKCGANEECCYNEVTAYQLVERQLCFSCDWYWRYLYSPVKEKNRHHHSTAIVVNGGIYTDGGNVENPGQHYFVGHGGAKFRIRMLDGSRDWITNNLWAGGEISPHWRDLIPDTAEFMPAQQKGGLVNEFA